MTTGTSIQSDLARIAAMEVPGEPVPQGWYMVTGRAYVKGVRHGTDSVELLRACLNALIRRDAIIAKQRELLKVCEKALGMWLAGIDAWPEPAQVRAILAALQKEIGE